MLGRWLCMVSILHLVLNACFRDHQHTGSLDDLYNCELAYTQARDGIDQAYAVTVGELGVCHLRGKQLRVLKLAAHL